MRFVDLTGRWNADGVAGSLPASEKALKRALSKVRDKRSEGWVSETPKTREGTYV